MLTLSPAVEGSQAFQLTNEQSQAVYCVRPNFCHCSFEPNCTHHFSEGAEHAGRRIEDAEGRKGREDALSKRRRR